jgi:hypothetical protein
MKVRMIVFVKNEHAKDVKKNEIMVNATILPYSGK